MKLEICENLIKGETMKVIQTKFEISDELWEKVANGEYIRDGGVIRNAKGQIIKILNEIKQNSNVGKTILLCSLLLSAGVAIGMGVEKIRNNKKETNNQQNLSRENEMILKQYNSEVKNYIETIERMNLTPETIQKLLSALYILKPLLEGKSGTIIIDLDKLNLLFKIINDYTLDFAKNNNYAIESNNIEELPILEKIELCLNQQLEIFNSKNNI